jgi:CubicO group peptidase (beta-lactamase class C family)
VLHQQGYGDFDADRLYLIASASKILSVGVVMKLHDEKKLDIDEPISTYLTEWGETKVGNVTAAQLFSNSSGLPTLEEVSGSVQNPSSPYVSNLCQYNFAGTLQDCSKILYETEPPREPDTEFGYGGSQWQLGGALAEVASGKSWAELIDETYVKPCEVPSLGYTNQYAKSALGYPKNFMGDVANLDPAERDTANPNIEGGAYITAPDYAKLLMMHLNGGKCGKNQVLSQASVKRMQEDRVSEYGGMVRPPFTGYGMGWWIADGYVADPGAYGAFPWIDEERGYAGIIMIELTSTVGAQLALSAKPALDGVLDGAKK